MKVTRRRASPHAALALQQRSKGITRWRDAYKLAETAGQLIQSVLQLLTSLLLSAWSWTQSAALITTLSEFCSHAWTALQATMTVEVINASETLNPVPVLPILRLNSETMEEYLPVRPQQTGELFSSGSNCNSSDGEHDSGFVLSEAEEHERLDFTPRLPAEPFVNRRDSDSSDVSSDGHDEKGSDELSERLINQVELMFSDDHLAKDGFLLKHVRRRSDGFVSLKLVAGLRKVKQISRDFPVILAALRKSTKLEINEEGTKVRRHEPLSTYLKSLPTTPNKEKENAKASNGASSDSAQDELLNRVHMRNNYTNQANTTGTNNGWNRKAHRNSNASSGSSNGSSRNSSFSSPYHPSDLMYRNMMAYVPVSFNDDNPQVARRRGGSLPIPMMVAGQQYLPPPHYFPQQRNSMTYLSPNSSPPSSTEMRPRPKSNSYCEGVTSGQSATGTTGGTSLWLQRRHASSRNSSEGNVVISGVVRQPRGPDGTKGFSEGYRQLVIKENDETQATMSALSA